MAGVHNAQCACQLFQWLFFLAAADNQKFGAGELLPNGPKRTYQRRETLFGPKRADDPNYRPALEHWRPLCGGGKVDVRIDAVVTNVNDLCRRPFVLDQVPPHRLAVHDDAIDDAIQPAEDPAKHGCRETPVRPLARQDNWRSGGPRRNDAVHVHRHIERVDNLNVVLADIVTDLKRSPYGGCGREGWYRKVENGYSGGVKVGTTETLGNEAADMGLKPTAIQKSGCFSELPFTSAKTKRSNHEKNGRRSWHPHQDIHAAQFPKQAVDL
jgi:hypothetical protein